MNLLEYQAKDLFRRVGIPVLPAQEIQQPQDLKGLTIPYPVVLKSQVYAGGRAKAGGIRFVENTIDAVAAAQIVFNLSIHGQKPDVLLAEAKYEPERELYLAVVLDQTLGRPVLLGSVEGGVDVEAVMAGIQQVIVDQEFSPFYARRLALMMGLEGDLLRTISAIVERMYALFVQKDLDVVEINPLAVNAAGEVMALDGKVSVNDDALGRHPELAQWRPTEPTLDAPEIAYPDGMSWMTLEGSIGVVCNGASLGMAILDQIADAGGTAAFVLNVGGDAIAHPAQISLADRLATGLEVLHDHPDLPKLKVVLINLLNGDVPNAALEQTIARFLKRRDRLPVPVVVRLAGYTFDPPDLPDRPDLDAFADLGKAIAHALALVQSAPPNAS